MDTQRFILFIALSMFVFLIWDAWQKEYRPAPVAPSAVAERDIPQAPEGSKDTRTPPTTQTDELTKGERVRVSTDVLDVEIDTQGGDMRSLLLPKHPVHVDKPNEPLQLLTDQGSELFIAQSGLIGKQDNIWPNHKTAYRAEHKRYTLNAGEEQIRVPLHWSTPSGLQVTKVYTFQRNSYLVKVDYQIRNRSGTEQAAYLYAQFLRSHTESNSLFAVHSYTGGVIYTPANKYEKISFSDMDKKALHRETASGWVAMLQHYFVGAWLPQGDNERIFYSDVLPGPRYVIGYKSATPVRVAPGQEAVLQAQVYLGPKEQKRLETLAEGMLLTVDYGWLTFISAPLFWVLKYIHEGVGNWGWAIILLTILIKLIFYPLSAASYKSMAQMRRLQPKMASLKERYKDDRQKMNQAMMEMYRTEKINPLGGCLPILVQIPVFLALYWVLLESVEMRQAPFALWLNDLSSPDPYYILPLLMGVTMLAQQWLNPQPMDPIQQKVMMALPVVFTVFFIFFPAGLVLYWVVQNILSILQQWWITKRLEDATKAK